MLRRGNFFTFPKVLGAFGVLALFAVQDALSYGVGITTYPILTGNKLFSAEATGIFTEGGGVGMQARYTQKLSSSILLDGGAGLSSGDRSGRVFFGADFEIFPDYQNQPRFSVKTSFTHAREFDLNQNILSLNPIVSKGFNFWGLDAYPYLSIPMGLSLNDGTNSYQTLYALSLGASSRLPLEGFDYLILSVQAQVNLANTFSGLLLGLTYPLAF